MNIFNTLSDTLNILSLVLSLIVSIVINFIEKKIIIKKFEKEMILNELIDKELKNIELVIRLKNIDQELSALQKNRKMKTRKTYSSISEELIDKKLKNDKKAIYTAFSFPLLSLLLRHFFDVAVDNVIIFIFFILMIIATAHYILTLYRYTNGFYGTNYDEARELLQFIQKDNNINGPTGKKIFNEEEITSPVTNILVENL